jgi:hypothetical protein
MASRTIPKSSDLTNFLPNAYSIINYNDGAPGLINNGQPISLGIYDRANKLPYTINYTLDIQWQPRANLAVELGYVGNIGRHQVIPVPFNQPIIVYTHLGQPRPQRRPQPAEVHLRIHHLRRQSAGWQRISGDAGRRQRRSPRSLHRLRGGVHRLQGRWC